MNDLTIRIAELEQERQVKRYHQTGEYTTDTILQQWNKDRNRLQERNQRLENRIAMQNSQAIRDADIATVSGEHKGSK